MLLLLLLLMMMMMMVMTNSDVNLLIEDARYVLICMLIYWSPVRRYQWNHSVARLWTVNSTECTYCLQCLQNIASQTLRLYSFVFTEQRQFRSGPESVVLQILSIRWRNLCISLRIRTFNWRKSTKFVYKKTNYINSVVCNIR